MSVHYLEPLVGDGVQFAVPTS